MKTIEVASIKATVPFKAGSLPQIDPGDPTFVLVLGAFRIPVRINPKAARKLTSWEGSAVLQGKLVVQDGRLVMLDAGFTFLDPKPVPASGFTSP